MKATSPRNTAASSRDFVYILERFPADTLNFVYNEMEVLEAEGFRFDIYSLLPSVYCPEAARRFGERTVAVKPVSVFSLVNALGYYLLRRPFTLLKLFATLPLENRTRFLHKFPRTVSHLLFGVYFAHLLRDDPCHVHAHFAHKAATAALCAARLNRSTFSFTAHGSATIHPPDRYGLRSKVRHASFVVAVSEFNKAKILEACPGCDPGRIIVNRTGILVEDFPLRPEPGSRTGPARILCVASLYPIKNHEGLLAACRELASAGVDFVLDLVGKDDDGRRAGLEALAGEYGIADRVRFHGVEDHGKVADRLARADVFVLASHSEGIPVAMMEAMATGVPVVGPRVTGLPELVAEGADGWLADPGRPEEFAAILKRIISGDEDLSGVRARARRKIEEEFDMRANAGRLAARLRRLLGQRPSCPIR